MTMNVESDIVSGLRDGDIASFLDRLAEIVSRVGLLESRLEDRDRLIVAMLLANGGRIEYGDYYAEARNNPDLTYGHDSAGVTLHVEAANRLVVKSDSADMTETFSGFEPIATVTKTLFDVTVPTRRLNGTCRFVAHEQRNRHHDEVVSTLRGGCATFTFLGAKKPAWKLGNKIPLGYWIDGAKGRGLVNFSEPLDGEPARHKYVVETTGPFSYAAARGRSSR